MANLHQHSDYDKDFYAWALESAELLRQKKFDQIDIEHMAEEIESMGKSDKRSLISHLCILMAHLLKWKYQPEFRSKSWKFSIRNARYKMIALLEDSPSLKKELESKFDKAYKDAVSLTADQTGIVKHVFSKECPFSIEQCFDNEFFPD